MGSGLLAERGEDLKTTPEALPPWGQIEALNLPDEVDNFVYEAAFAASPATIVTHNVRDFRKPEIDWPGVLVKTPQQILTEALWHA